MKEKNEWQKRFSVISQNKLEILGLGECKKSYFYVQPTYVNWNNVESWINVEDESVDYLSTA